MPFDDDFFNDPFENLIRDFFRGSSLEQRRRSQRFIKGEEEDRVIDFVEDGKKLYLVFELPGFDEKDVGFIYLEYILFTVFSSSYFYRFNWSLPIFG